LAVGGGDIRIEGQRVILRDPVRADLDVLAYWLEPDHRWHELDGPLGDLPRPAERERILQERRALVETVDRPVPRTMLTIAARDNDQMLGQVTWSGPSMGGAGPSIVIFNPDLWGYGLGYEAFGLWVDELLASQPDLPELRLRTWSRNTGMVRLARKLGFVEEPGQRRGLLRRLPEVVGFRLARESWVERFPDGFARTLEPV
jgi:RimJ/RimL family protein N-acetyltransferase